MTRKFEFDSLNIDDPCTEPWENMDGSEKKRFCGKCEKDVFNLTAHSRNEAERIVRRSGGRICIRFARLPNGTTITSDRPLYQISKRAGSIAAGVMATTLSVSGVAYSQGGVMFERDSVRETQPAVSQKLESPQENTSDLSVDSENTSQIRFQVFDHTGSFIPGAKVALKGIDTKALYAATSDSAGYASFTLIPKGSYSLSVSFDGFSSYAQRITLTQDVEIDFDVFLNAGYVTGMLVDESYEIPLFKAVSENDMETVTNSLVNGFDVKTRDSDAQTILHVAVTEIRPEMVELIIRFGADVNAKDSEGETPIVLLSEDVGEDDEDVIKILRMLISENADLNVRSEESDETILMQAAYYGDKKVLELLLNAGADSSLKNEDGKTAFQMSDSEEIRSIFNRYGIFN